MGSIQVVNSPRSSALSADHQGLSRLLCQRTCKLHTLRLLLLYSAFWTIARALHTFWTIARALPSLAAPVGS